MPTPVSAAVTTVTPRTTCRSCGGPLTDVLHLGALTLNAFPAEPTLGELVPRVPLVLTVCSACSLAQLRHTTPPAWLFREYWYRSSVNETMVAELGGIAREASIYAHLEPGDWVLDIGANDGTLLRSYPTGLHRIAVEPAVNLQESLESAAELRIQDFFPTPALDGCAGRINAITAIAMCYDLEDPKGFFRGIQRLLHPEGVAIIQFQDLAQQIAAAAFDNIVHEHLEYYTLTSLQEVLTGTGLMICDVQPTPINGGSLRVVLRLANTAWRVSPAVERQLLNESLLGLGVDTIRCGDLSAFATFSRRVASMKRQILATVEAARATGPLDAYGASTKGNVLLQVLGLGADDVRQVADRSPEKWGRYTITGVPIVSEEIWRANPARVTLVPIWQFKQAILQREVGYLEGGGQLLFPLPYAEVVQQSWGSGR